MKRLPPRLRPLAFALAAAALMATQACEPEPPYEMDFNHSVNVAPASYTAEHLVNFPPIKKEVFEKSGPPDFIRVLWRRDKRPATLLEIKRPEYKMKKKPPEVSWLYLDRGVEVFFNETGGYRVEELDDQIRLMCERGDPERIEQRNLSRTDFFTVWIYDSTGEHFSFDRNGRLIKKNYYTPMGGRLIR